MNVGVLALQGAFREHKQALERLGATVKEIRLPQDLSGLQGVIIPGGESTTMAKLMKAYNLDTGLTTYFEEGGALWGTCAGAIVIAKELLKHPEQPHLGLMDIDVERNAYGRQVDSFEVDVPVKGLKTPFRTIFIRAPRIARVGEGLETLAEFKGDPIMVKGERLLATVFHPELSGDDRVHQLFLETMIP